MVTPQSWMPYTILLLYILLITTLVFIRKTRYIVFLLFTLLSTITYLFCHTLELHIPKVYLLFAMFTGLPTLGISPWNIVSTSHVTGL